MAPASAEHSTSVLVVGGGPTGLAAAITLARAGIGVTVVDSRRGPHPDVARGALTPRAVTALANLADLRDLPSHAVDGVRVLVHGRSLELPWPEHPDHRNGAMVVSRRNLDGLLHDTAAEAGALMWPSTTAISPLVDDGIVTGATLEQRHDDGATTTIDARASYVLIADGALSHFGRALGTARTRSYPVGVVARTRLASPASEDSWMEAAIDLHDQHGAQIPGFGWVFPGGDGYVTVGVGVLTAFREAEGPPIMDLLVSWLRRLPGHWEIDGQAVTEGRPFTDPLLNGDSGTSPSDTSLSGTSLSDTSLSDTSLDEVVIDVATGRIPMGGSVHPKSGPTWLVAGDAAGMASPINGAGLESALETGRIAADVLIEAIGTSNGLVLRRFERYLEAERGRQLKVARLAARAVARPRIAGPLTNWASRSPRLLGGGLRIVTGMLRDDAPGRAERNYELAARLSTVIPERRS